MTPCGLKFKRRLRTAAGFEWKGRLRTAQGWSQSELGTRLAVSRQTVNAMEAGRYDPSLPLAFRIAAIFGLRIEEVFEPG